MQSPAGLYICHATSGSAITASYGARGGLPTAGAFDGRTNTQKSKRGRSGGCGSWMKNTLFRFCTVFTSILTEFPLSRFKATRSKPGFPPLEVVCKAKTPRRSNSLLTKHSPDAPPINPFGIINLIPPFFLGTQSLVLPPQWALTKAVPPARDGGGGRESNYLDTRNTENIKEFNALNGLKTRKTWGLGTPRVHGLQRFMVQLPADI
jgi:hypothetical protein